MFQVDLALSSTLSPSQSSAQISSMVLDMNFFLVSVARSGNDSRILAREACHVQAECIVCSKITCFVCVADLRVALQ